MTPIETDSSWESYRQPAAHTAGAIQIWPDFASPELENKRDIYVYLPPGYDQGDRRYPVLYMHDGQNLFDAALSFSGEWGVDETMDLLAQEGIKAIVVAIGNTGPGRMEEYSPYREKQGGGLGEAYLDFLLDSLKPHIDAGFRTLPGRETTGLMGSSLGGLISLYGFFSRREAFGFVGAMSPSVRFAGGALLSTLRAAPFVPGRIYLDFGTRELAYKRSDRLLLNFYSRRYLRSVRQVYELLARKGYEPGRDLLYVEAAGAAHNEAAWASRLPRALRFLLGSFT